jgi:hypothetical protein
MPKMVNVEIELRGAQAIYRLLMGTCFPVGEYAELTRALRALGDVLVAEEKKAT